MIGLRDIDLASKGSWIIAALLVAAFLLRLNVVVGSAYHWDEEREWIPVAQSISLEPGNLNLPVRAISHPIVPAYLIKLGSLIAGENALGFRLMSLLAGVATVAVVAFVALRTGGFWAAFWATGFLTFNEYHIYVSSLAIDKPFQLLFVALAIAAFVRFLQSENVRALYLAGAMTGVAFLCKETSGLLLPGFFAALIFSRQHRPWLLRVAPYIALLIFAAVISPDLLVNFFMRDELEFSYSDHLQRAAGIGFTRHHLLFFLRDAIQFVYEFRGEELADRAPEYAAMNSVTGVILLGVACWTVVEFLIRPDARRDAVKLYLAAAFWAVFGFFLLTDVSTEGAIEHLTYVAWFWSDLTLVPASLLAGAFVASQIGRRRAALFAVSAVGLIMAFAAATLTRVGTPRGPMVAFNPEYLLPPDGRSFEVTASFSYCMVCEKEMTPELLDVRLHRPDGTTSSVLGTDLVRVADPGGTRLLLWARDAAPGEYPDPDEPWQDVYWYEVSYELTSPSGRTYLAQDRVFSPLYPSEYEPRFWSGEPNTLRGF